MKITLEDKSGGFWTEMLLRRNNPALVIQQNLVPNQTVMRIIGREAITSVKGSVKHKLVAETKQGKMVLARFPQGAYSFGIIKRKSPDGTPFEKLKESTIRHRKWKAEQGQIDTQRGKAYILRETSQHILQGLRILNLTSGSKNALVEIGWSGEDEDIAILQNSLNYSTGPWFDKSDDVSFPKEPREFIGFQDEFIENYLNMLKTILNGN